MRRMRVALVAVLVAVSTASLFWVLCPFSPLPVSVEWLSGNSSLWVGKRVLTEGKIEGIVFIPERVPPYNYILTSAHAHFGVFWRNPKYELDEQDVLVVGVVKYGITHPIYFGFPSYYLDAEAVIKLPVSFPTCLNLKLST